MKKVVMLARAGRLCKSGDALRRFLEQSEDYELRYCEYAEGAFMPIREMQEQSADFFVVFDLVGMEQITLAGVAAMNRVDARILHFLTRSLGRQAQVLAGPMSLTQTFFCDGDAERERLLSVYPELPDVRAIAMQEGEALITAFLEIAQEEYRHEPVIL